jgi:hypothetical protein
MYVDLLMRALGDGGDGTRSSDLLLADLVHSRARVRAAEGQTASSTAADALARELSYDGALIRFCRSIDVPAGPSQFSNPHEERARLERELADRGIDVTTAAPALLSS